MAKSDGNEQRLSIGSKISAISNINNKQTVSRNTNLLFEMSSVEKKHLQSTSNSLRKLSTKKMNKKSDSQSKQLIKQTTKQLSQKSKLHIQRMSINLKNNYLTQRTLQNKQVMLKPNTTIKRNSAQILNQKPFLNGKN